MTLDGVRFCRLAMRFGRFLLLRRARRGGGRGLAGHVLADAAAGARRRDRRGVDRARPDAARDRRCLGERRRADVAAAALRMVPLVRPRAPDPRRQLRDRRRHDADPPARQDGARRRDARRACASTKAGPFARFAPSSRAPSRSSRRTASHERRRGDDRARCRRRLAGRAIPPRHLPLQQGVERPRGAEARAAGDGAAPRRGVAGARSGDAAAERRRGADARLDRREGNRDRRRSRPRRRRVRQPASPRHAAADRPDRHLRPRRRVRRQPAQARPARRRAVQHLHAHRPAADADRGAGQGVAARRGAPGADQGALLRRPRRRQQRVQRDARRSQSCREPIPAQAARRDAPLHHLRRHRRRRQVDPHRAAGRAPARARPARRLHARARRHAARRDLRELLLHAADGRRRRDAARVRGAARPHRARHRAGARARRDGPVRPLQRRHLRLPGRRPRPGRARCCARSSAGSRRDCSPT